MSSTAFGIDEGFRARHIGTDADAQAIMLNALGYDSVEALVEFMLFKQVRSDQARRMVGEKQEPVPSSFANAMVAAAKVLARSNPDLDVLSVDKDTGVVTVRQKSTGKTVTLDFEDLKRGRIDIKGADGERVTIDGGEGAVNVKTAGKWPLPDWLPKYADAKIEQGTLNAVKGEANISATFTTSDSADQVISFYENAMKDHGMRTSMAGSVLTGRDDDRRKAATVTAMPSGTGTRAVITYTSRGNE